MKTVRVGMVLERSEGCLLFQRDMTADPVRIREGERTFRLFAIDCDLSRTEEVRAILENRGPVRPPGWRTGNVMSPRRHIDPTTDMPLWRPDWLVVEAGSASDQARSDQARSDEARTTALITFLRPILPADAGGQLQLGSGLHVVCKGHPLYDNHDNGGRPKMYFALKQFSNKRICRRFESSGVFPVAVCPTGGPLAQPNLIVGLVVGLQESAFSNRSAVLVQVRPSGPPLYVDHAVPASCSEQTLFSIYEIDEAQFSHSFTDRQVQLLCNAADAMEPPDTLQTLPEPVGRVILCVTHPGDVLDEPDSSEDGGSDDEGSDGGGSDGGGSVHGQVRKDAGVRIAEEAALALGLRYSAAQANALGRANAVGQANTVALGAQDVDLHIGGHVIHTTVFQLACDLLTTVSGSADRALLDTLYSFVDAVDADQQDANHGGAPAEGGH
jgi:hypothetical protein